MMGQAARDPLFWAAMTVAAQDSIWAIGRPNATDLCLRCHFPQGWLDGRSDPTNAALMTGEDYDAVHCGLCHRLVDPFFETTHDGTREGSDWEDYWDETNLSKTPSADAALDTYLLDEAVASTISLFNGNPFFNISDNLPHSPAYTESASGQYFVDTGTDRRGPFSDAKASHPMIYSRFHKSRYFCATCHDISNPALANLAYEGTAPGDGSTVLPSESNAAYSYFHVERTFSEFMLSDFGLQGGAPGSGAYAPEVFETSMADNSIARCQDCHMRDVAGRAASQSKAVLRPAESEEHPQSGVPSHDLTGGNVWVPRLLASTLSDSPNYDEINAAILDQGPATLTLDLSAGLGLEHGSLLAAADRALANLGDAATIEDAVFNPDTGELSFRVINHTGHKLISGFPEGRRMWLNVQAYDDAETLLWEINPYDESASTLKGLPASYADPDGILPDPQALSGAESYNDELVYEMLPSSSLTGESHSFHFVLSDGNFKDNRIPPRGFRIAEADARRVVPAWDGSPAPGYFTAAEYAGGYDEVSVLLPPGSAHIEITLYYQTTSREYLEFLRDEINGTADTLGGTGAGGDEPYLIQTDPFFDQLKAWGDSIWQLWRHNREAPGAAPIEMVEAELEAGGRLIVEKQTDPDGATQVFSFSGDASGAISDGQQITVSELWPGTYTVTETVPSGWQLSSIECNDSNSSGDIPSATASFILAKDETVTCVFTNTSTCTALELNNDTVTTTESYSGCPSVTIGPAWIVASPGAVSVQASQWISIGSGFSVELGSSFAAGIDPDLEP
jgi:hypothetical protein